MHRPFLALGWGLIAGALVLGGCGTTPPSRFYTLEPLPEAAQPAVDADGPSINVGPVLISEGLDRPQLMSRLGPHELAIHEYDRWSEPLADNILRVLTEDLSVLLGSQRVGSVPDSETPEPSWRVTVDVLSFEAGADGSATLIARWRLYKPSEDVPSITRKSVLVAPLPARDGAGIAAAMSSNVAALAQDIAEALKGG